MTYQSAQGLYPLADALQMCLLVDHKKGTIKASRENDKRELDIGDSEYSLVLDAKIEASYVDKQWAWVLMKVMGDLSIMLMLDIGKTNLMAYVINAAEVPLTVKRINAVNGKPPVDALSAVWEGVVAVYEIAKNGKTWVRKHVADYAVDSRPDEDAGKDGAADSGDAASTA